MQESLLNVKDLTVEYKSGNKVVQAVNHVSFVLNKGETLGLVGETGAGKTTIAKAILQILPVPQSKIVSGEIVFDRENILELSQHKMRGIKGNKDRKSVV